MQRDVHWDAIGELGFWAAERAAKTVANGYAGVEEDDVFQEALIYIATHTEELEKEAEYGYSLPGIRGGEAGERKAVARQLTRRMQDWARSQQLRSTAVAAELDLSRKDDRPDLTRWSNRPEPIAYAGMAYTPAIVEAALPMLWDESLFTGLPQERGPEEGMPRAASDKSHGNTHFAVYADIRRAWGEAPLTRAHRATLVAIYALGWTQEQFAEHEGITHPAVIKRIDRAICLIADNLNGTVVDHDGTDD